MDKKVIPNGILLAEVGTLLEEGRDVSLTPLGRSMLPFIVGGKDTVTLRKLATIQVGDIVLAHLADTRYVLHRVISTDGDIITLMGDGNIIGTERCHKSDILGTVIAINGKKPTKGVIWAKLKPIRRYLLAFYRLIRRIIRRIKRLFSYEN